jgi:DNA ligase D-like protein (predicted 3'-phosphoesterase)
MRRTWHPFSWKQREQPGPSSSLKPASKCAHEDGRRREIAVSGPEALERYLEKRDFSRSPEPPGTDEVGPNDPKNLFVIHKHDASNLHYDFRIRVGETLKSWAVPKGFSTDPSEKRLALPTEDHPLAYAEFEGVIPEEEYGGGTTLVWDAGLYRNLKVGDDGDEVPLGDQIDGGHLTIWLKGEKLVGGYALTRTSSDDDEERWILVKMDDEGADARRNPVSTEPTSVLSGRTLEEVRQEEPDQARETDGERP